MYMQTELAKIVGFNGNSMAQLISFLLKYNFTEHHFENATQLVGGIDAVLWLGCRNDNKTIVQVEVAYAGEKSIESYSSSVKNPYLLSMPKGLFCSGLPEAKTPVSFPSKFEMSFDYTDVGGKIVHDIDMYYNGNERILSMRLNAVTDKDVPFVGNASIPKGLTNINIIHDFQYGFQYLLDAENNVCMGVGAIDEKFGNVEMLNASTKEIDLKEPAKLFLIAADAKFYSAGRRNVDSVPFDVYVTKVNSTPTTSTVIEMLFTTENWVAESAVAPFLHSIIQYHKDQSNKEKKTIIRVHSFKNGSAAETQKASLSIYPCLKLVEDSYLYVYVKNATLKDLEKLGIGRVREGLREAVAHVAGVSVLRIANFFEFAGEIDKLEM
ncbi:unnamed protein product [Gongylonema pulchrum]|uniref:Uncharacterized protein n=1 Tax=Gongylonema pulchrum TaxID=637853 RepID=A0A3P7MP91_9BILA|nr:unnamed protein product [Gongylonema pulchrum]